jgi:hypothetical protein
MPDRTEQIKHVWHLVYDLLNGPGRAQTYNAFVSLPPRFDQDLLNSVSGLRASDSELTKKVEEVRAHISIAQSMGLFGEKDLESINIELDKLIQGEQ